MSDFTDAATQWAVRVRGEAAASAAQAAAIASLRSRSIADWPALRTKILSAISAVAPEYASIPPGTDNVGPFTITIITDGDKVGDLDVIGIKIISANPSAAALAYVRATYDRTVLFRGNGPADDRVYSMPDLAARTIEPIVRRVVIEGLASPKASPLPWP